jgi:hypothetical protein
MKSCYCSAKSAKKREKQTLRRDAETQRSEEIEKSDLTEDDKGHKDGI